MARKTVRDMWKAKLAGQEVAPTAHGRRAAAAVTAPMDLQRTPFDGLVLGIDPSLRGTGLAVIEFKCGRQPMMLSCATVKVKPKVPMAEALAEIHRSVASMVARFTLTHVALEQTIYVQNFQTAQILGAARGAAITAVALQELPIFEYAPLRVKQAVVGAGRASKEQMARTVMGLLGHGAQLGYDEADAAGVALCHAFTWRG
jgi:crossover junction endodeoxyribonuclease RuvC